MLRQTGSKGCIVSLVCAVLVAAKPPPANYGKPAFVRSLGPPFGGPGMSSISVPYVPKSSPFFPKFVDPKTMIAKKTDMLSTLFAGLGPVDGGAAPAASFPKYPPGFAAPATPILYSGAAGFAQVPEVKEVNEVNGLDDIAAKDAKTKRGAVKGASKLGSPKPFPPFAPFAPFAPKFSPFGPPVAPFAPFAPKFSPFAPKFSPFAPSFAAPGAPGYAYPGAAGFYDSDAATSRRRRSVGAEGETTKALGPPPAYPGLAPIAEEPESLQSRLLKLYDPANAPKETLPGMFGPFGPFGPYAPAGPLDPAMNFAPKSPKASFLDALFKNLASTTPATLATLLDEPAVTELPIPKSTIVPADFWVPSSIIPGPTEYTDKVSTFLDKLFTSLALNKTAMTGKTIAARGIEVDDPEKPKVTVARSIEDIRNIAAAKDSIVDSILTELGDLKTDMIGTLDDFVVYQKSLPVAGGPGKKPLKPMSPFAAFFHPPTPDPSVPFKQRMIVLSQVFDMLTGLQRNITAAVQDAIKTSSDSSAEVENKDLKDNEAVVVDPNVAALQAFNSTLLEAIRNRIATLDNAFGPGYGKAIMTGPAKRDVEDADYDVPIYYENHRDHNHEQFKRAVQMQMHQGYQSMPPGTIESVQAGGGTVPGHQGGGIKLLDSQDDYDWSKWSEWAEYFKNQNEGRKHRHNHH